MKELTQKDIDVLFSGLCCSKCKNDFSLESIKILERDCDLMLCRLTCAKCGKDFGEIIFNYNCHAKRHSALEIIDGPPPINTDDVLDAHEFIKKNL